MRKEIQTEDNVVITIDFKNGSRGSILYTSLGPRTLSKEYIEIFGGSKTMIIDNFRSATFYNQNGKKKICGFIQDKGHFNEFKAFIGAIQLGQPSPLSLQEIILSTQTTFDIIKSIKENRVVSATNIWG